MDEQNSSITAEDAENAAQFFKKNIHEFRDSLRPLSRKALENILVNIVGFPLHTVKFPVKQQFDIYNHATQLIDAKSIMVLHMAEKQSVEDLPAVEETQEPVTQESKENG